MHHLLCMCLTPAFISAYRVSRLASRWPAEPSLSPTALQSDEIGAPSLLVQLGHHFFSLFPCLRLLTRLVCPISTSFPVAASHILAKQMWICKCYIKWRSRCVTARTEWGQSGHADTPRMQRKQQGPKWLPPSWMPGPLPGEAAWKWTQFRKWVIFITIHDVFSSMRDESQKQQ